MPALSINAYAAHGLRRSCVRSSRTDASHTRARYASAYPKYTGSIIADRTCDAAKTRYTGETPAAKSLDSITNRTAAFSFDSNQVACHSYTEIE